MEFVAVDVAEAVGWDVTVAASGAPAMELWLWLWRPLQLVVWALLRLQQGVSLCQVAVAAAVAVSRRV